ncbi:type IV pilus modification PilV family protein [Rubrobacter marinus]|uniref:type IV pilus modification PilV family protein n=1 Tax=Rubrobacter marinus TaxID=2653852 RepID=UPI00140CCEC8|nr:prepilin-type N-terminal cleavage/methylation domain-containing protein [Rubrobacter marinus]
MIKALKNEAGYSLVEVMASIVILSIAIIPMVSMFDVGLKSASQGGKYDKARTLANLTLEEAKSLPYNTSTVGDQEVRDTFPEPASTTTTYSGSGSYESSYRAVTGGASGDFSGFEFKVRKQFLDQPPVGSATDPAAASQSFADKASDDGLIRITVTVRWDGNKTYSADGVVAK